MSNDNTWQSNEDMYLDVISGLEPDSEEEMMEEVEMSEVAPQPPQTRLDPRQHAIPSAGGSTHNPRPSSSSHPPPPSFSPPPMPPSPHYPMVHPQPTPYPYPQPPYQYQGQQYQQSHPYYPYYSPYSYDQYNHHPQDPQYAQLPPFAYAPSSSYPNFPIPAPYAPPHHQINTYDHNQVSNPQPPAGYSSGDHKRARRGKGRGKRQVPVEEEVVGRTRNPLPTLMEGDEWVMVDTTFRQELLGWRMEDDLDESDGRRRRDARLVGVSRYCIVVANLVLAAFGSRPTLSRDLYRRFRLCGGILNIYFPPTKHDGEKLSARITFSTEEGASRGLGKTNESYTLGDAKTYMHVTRRRHVTSWALAPRSSLKALQKFGARLHPCEYLPTILADPLLAKIKTNKSLRSVLPLIDPESTKSLDSKPTDLGKPAVSKVKIPKVYPFKDLPEDKWSDRYFGYDNHFKLRQPTRAPAAIHPELINKRKAIRIPHSEPTRKFDSRELLDGFSKTREQMQNASREMRRKMNIMTIDACKKEHLAVTSTNPTAVRQLLIDNGAAWETRSKMGQPPSWLEVLSTFIPDEAVPVTGLQQSFDRLGMWSDQQVLHPITASGNIQFEETAKFMAKRDGSQLKPLFRNGYQFEESHLEDFGRLGLDTPIALDRQVPTQKPTIAPSPLGAALTAHAPVPLSRQEFTPVHEMVQSSVNRLQVEASLLDDPGNVEPIPARSTVPTGYAQRLAWKQAKLASALPPTEDSDSESDHDGDCDGDD